MPSPLARLLDKARSRLARAKARRFALQPPCAAEKGGHPQASDETVASQLDGMPEVSTAVAGIAPLNVKVGVAVRPRLARLLSPEWHQTSLRHGHDVSAMDLQLILLEVRDSTVPGWEHTHHELVEAMQRWTDSGIPVVAWVTTGPTGDVDWLKHATSVAAASEVLAEALRSQHPSVEVLLAAAQPRRHRPTGSFGGRLGAVLLVDGLTQLESNEKLVEVLAPAIGPMKPDDVSVQRIRGKSSSITLPGLLVDRVSGTISDEEVATTAARFRVGVDLSACAPDAAWTSMALASSGATLVGTPGLSGNLPPEIAGLVAQVEDPKDLRSEIVARIVQEELSAREGHRFQRAVLTNHTMQHRVRRILDAAQIDSAPSALQSVSAIVPTNRLHEILNVLENLGRQSLTNRELVLVLHGLEVPEAELQELATDAGVDNLVVVNADASLTLGACMNLGVDASSGRYVAKMDDDNFYGEQYLADLVNAFSYSDAGIVGKWCHYVWLRSSGAVVLRYPDSEHRPERRIQGGSMLFEGDVVRSVRFSDIPRAVDSDILDRAAQQGVGIYSADRFNFVSIRGADRLSHTWTVEDSTFMTKSGRLMFYGDPRQHASV